MSPAPTQAPSSAPTPVPTPALTPAPKPVHTSTPVPTSTSTSPSALTPPPSPAPTPAQTPAPTHDDRGNSTRARRLPYLARLTFSLELLCLGLASLALALARQAASVARRATRHTCTNRRNNRRYSDGRHTSCSPGPSAGTNWWRAGLPLAPQPACPPGTSRGTRQGTSPGHADDAGRLDTGPGAAHEDGEDNDESARCRAPGSAGHQALLTPSQDRALSGPTPGSSSSSSHGTSPSSSSTSHHFDSSTALKTETAEIACGADCSTPLPKRRK